MHFVMQFVVRVVQTAEATSDVHHQAGDASGIATATQPPHVCTRAVCKLCIIGQEMPLPAQPPHVCARAVCRLSCKALSARARAYKPSLHPAFVCNAGARAASWSTQQQLRQGRCCSTRELHAPDTVLLLYRCSILKAATKRKASRCCSGRSRSNAPTLGLTTQTSSPSLTFWLASSQSVKPVAAKRQLLSLATLMASLCWTCFAGTRERCQAKLLLQGCGHKGAPGRARGWRALVAILTPLLVSCCGGGAPVMWLQRCACTRGRNRARHVRGRPVLTIVRGVERTTVTDNSETVHCVGCAAPWQQSE